MCKSTEINMDFISEAQFEEDFEMKKCNNSTVLHIFRCVCGDKVTPKAFYHFIQSVPEHLLSLSKNGNGNGKKWQKPSCSNFFVDMLQDENERDKKRQKQ